MSRARMIGAALLALSCAALLVGVASAARPPAGEEPVVPPGFKVQGTHGYWISVSVYRDAESEPALIGVTASRPHESVSYVAPAKVTADSIRADLGRLGRVDLVLHPSGEKKTVKVRCIRRGETFEPSTYEGVVEFDGEGGFTRAKATRVAALPPLVMLAGGQFCHDQGYGESRGPGLPGARLKGVSYAGGRTLQYQFNKNRPGSKTVFSASLTERHGGLRIYRQFKGVLPARAFRFDPKVRTATLAPPTPFSGVAKVRRERDSISPLIAGNLQLAFPGRSVELAGPAVHVSFQHARLTNGTSATVYSGR